MLLLVTQHKVHIFYHDYLLTVSYRSDYHQVGKMREYRKQVVCQKKLSLHLNNPSGPAAHLEECVKFLCPMGEFSPYSP